jgi:hypothetical protein
VLDDLTQPAGVATSTTRAAAVTDVRHARREPSRDTVELPPVVDSSDGSTRLVVAMPDAAIPGPVVVLNLRLVVDADGRVASLDPVDDDALADLVDAVRETFVGQLLPGAGTAAATAPRWRLEVRFLEGEPRARWRLWRAS